MEWEKHQPMVGWKNKLGPADERWTNIWGCYPEYRAENTDGKKWKWSQAVRKTGWDLLTRVCSPRAEVSGGPEPLHLGAEELHCFSKPWTCALYEHMKAAPFIWTYEGCSLYMNIWRLLPSQWKKAVPFSSFCLLFSWTLFSLFRYQVECHILNPQMGQCLLPYSPLEGAYKNY